jgi:hypothetical protein
MRRKTTGAFGDPDSLERGVCRDEAERGHGDGASALVAGLWVGGCEDAEDGYWLGIEGGREYQRWSR